LIVIVIICIHFVVLTITQILERPTHSGGRFRCKQIGSWAKAQELLKQGQSYLDGGGDGEACEGLR